MTHQPHSSPHQGSEFAPRDFFNVLFRHKRKIVLFFFGTVSIVTIATVLMPKTYRSTAQLIIRIGRENATLDPTVAIGPAFNIDASRENEINSEIEVIRSRELAVRVVDLIGIDRVLGRSGGEDRDGRNTYRDSIEQRENGASTIAENLSVEAVKKATVINVGFEHRDPATAQAVLTNLIAAYQEKHMALCRPAGSYVFFERQTDTMGAELAEKEDSLRRLKNATGIASIETQRDHLISRLGTLRLVLEQVNADLAGSVAKILDLKKNLDTIPELLAGQKITGSTSSASDMLRSRLNDLRVKKVELLTKYGESSRLVTDLRRQIDETSELLDKEDFDNNRSNAMRQIQMTLFAEQSNYAALSAKAESVRRALDIARGELVKFNNDAVAIAGLQRRHELNELTYRKYIENLEQSRIDHDLKAGNFSNIGIVQAATLPLKPVRPRIPYNLALGVLFGLLGGLCFAFIAEILDHRLKSGEEIESHFGLVALGAVPLWRKCNNSRSVETIFSNNEMFEAIRGGLQSARLNGGGPPRVIGITSCYVGEGVSTVAASLAKALASRSNGSGVLLIDLNIENPSLHSRFGVPLSPGLTDMYRLNRVAAADGGDRFPMRNAAPGLDIVTAGVKAPMDTAFMEALSWFVTEGKRNYESLIIDIPSLARSTLAVELAGLLDGVLLVIEAERVRREVVKQAILKMSRSGVPIFGAVINKKKYYVPQWVYERL